jgi:hypothetical protein
MNLPPYITITIKHILTGIDGESYDVARVMGVAGVLFFMGMTCWNVMYKGMPFDYVNWGIGFGSVMGSMGIAIKLKEKTEPQG